jgi:hypothetical protein
MKKSTQDHCPSITYLKAFSDLEKIGYLTVYRKSVPEAPFFSPPKEVCSKKMGITI